MQRELVVGARARRRARPGGGRRRPPCRSRPCAAAARPARRRGSRSTAKPCSSKTRRSSSSTCCSTARWAGVHSGKPRDRRDAGHQEASSLRYGFGPRSCAIVVAGPWPGRTGWCRRSGSTTSRSEAASPVRPPGRSVRPMLPRNSTSPVSRVVVGRPARHRCRAASRDAVEGEHHRALGVARRVQHPRPGREVEHLGVGDGAHVVRRGPARPLAELLLEHLHERGVEQASGSSSR